MMIQHFLSQLQRALLHVFFPLECLHCGEEMASESSLLCTVCASLLDDLDPTNRCPFCFEEVDSLPCLSCKTKKRPLFEKAACFDYMGPIATLIKKMKYENQPHLAKSLAPFLALQWARLQWEKPDWILPIPLTWHHQFKRGYNQSALLAQELSAFLSIPLLSCLHRTGVSHSQAKVSKALRLQLSPLAFHVKEPTKLFGASLLIIDDVMTTGSTLQASGEALLPYSPKNIRALVLCKG